MSDTTLEQEITDACGHGISMDEDCDGCDEMNRWSDAQPETDR